MSYRKYLPLIALVASLTSGCQLTKNHLHCMIDAHHPPYSCPPCPYYDKATRTWQPMPEQYSGIPFLWSPVSHEAVPAE